MQVEDPNQNTEGSKQTAWHYDSKHRRITRTDTEDDKSNDHIAPGHKMVPDQVMAHPSTSRGYMLGFEAGKREQAKQHQADILRARIDELEAALMDDSEDITYRIIMLKERLANLEGEG